MEEIVKILSPIIYFKEDKNGKKERWFFAFSINKKNQIYTVPASIMRDGESVKEAIIYLLKNIKPFYFGGEYHFGKVPSKFDKTIKSYIEQQKENKKNE